MGGLSTGVSVAVALFLLVLVILWFLLPFAVFGVKGKLDDLILETRRTNEGLQAVAKALAARDAAGATTGVGGESPDDSPPQTVTEAISMLADAGYAVRPDGPRWQIKKGRSMQIAYSNERLMSVARDLGQEP